jgi:core-2/I-Branching enzyme
MKIAYIISAYKYPEQLIRLVSRLNTATAFFFIHVDKKADNSVYLEVVNGLSKCSNVHFLKRHRCDWGGFGHVKASLKGIAEILRRQLTVDYIILLTGQDYPIKTNEQISAFLEQSGGKSFMQSVQLPCESWPGAAGRMESWHVRIFGNQFILPNDNINIAWLRKFRNWPVVVLNEVLPKQRKFPEGFQKFGGASYWCFTRECAQYVHEFVQRHPSFVNFFKYVHVPDEHFFQTVLSNSKLKDTIINHDLHYKDWSGLKPNPAILRAKDFEALASSTKLFARKFDTTVDLEILDMIDQRVLGASDRQFGEAKSA